MSRQNFINIPTALVNEESLSQPSKLLPEILFNSITMDYKEFLKTLTALEPKEFVPQSSSKIQEEVLPADTEYQHLRVDRASKPDKDSVSVANMSLDSDSEPDFPSQHNENEYPMRFDDGSPVRDDLPIFVSSDISNAEELTDTASLLQLWTAVPERREIALSPPFRLTMAYNLRPYPRWTSSSAGCNDFHPPVVSCYSEQSSFPVGSVVFFIDGLEGAESASMMTPMVFDTNGSSVPVDMKWKNVLFPRRFICTFNAQLPGCYAVSVLNGFMQLHVQGSPFSINVSRNYDSIPYSSRHFVGYLQKPWGIAYSALSEKLYGADRDLHQIIIYNKDLTICKIFGSRGKKPDQFNKPTSIAVDNRNARLVIADKDNNRICIYTLDGKFRFKFGRTGHRNGQFSYPWGVAVSPKDSIIAVADSRNHRIQIFDSNGKFLRKYSVFETNSFLFKIEFDTPRGVAFDPTGENLYVSDFKINVIFKLNVELTEKTFFTPGIFLNRPQGITVDNVGNILICDSRNNCIKIINPSGEFISSIHGLSFHRCNWTPLDITLMPSGEIIVVDSTSKIRIF